MSESTADVRRDIEATRERMSETVGEIEAHVADRVDAVKQRLDVAQMIREHPWPALAVAFGAGLLLSATGADERVARATAGAVKGASHSTTDAARNLAAKVRGARSDSADESSDVSPAADSGTPGFAARMGTRILGLVSAPLAASFDVVLDDMRSASRELGESMRRRAYGGAGHEGVASVRDEAVTPAPVRVAEVSGGATSGSAAAEVPVPSEMLPSEIDARADAVEAVGGGTNEPPLAPGAGDLGARWA